MGHQVRFDRFRFDTETGRTVAGYRFFPDGRGTALRSDPRFADLIRRMGQSPL